MAGDRRKVIIPGAGEVTLTTADHVATGGEGMLYVKGGTAYKLFLDPARARQQGMADKIQLLSQLKHPFIVAPTSVLLDAQHQLIGYRMPAVAGDPLVKSFSNIWRDETGFTDDLATELAYRMRDGVQAVHDAGALIVDGNEMNYLRMDNNEPRLIDVDSWQIGRFKPTAIMPSVRDYSTDTFSTLSDWFGWGIVSFQLYTGMHPYKGTHPNFKRGDLEARMRANASVFDPQVRLNSAVRSFDAIPAGLRDWYVKTFQQGQRTVPPKRFEALTMPAAAVTRKVRTLAGGGSLKHDKLWTSPGTLRHISPNGLALYESAGRIEVYDLERSQVLELPAPLDGRRVIERAAVIVRAEGHYVWLGLADGKLTATVIFGQRDPRRAYLQRAPLPTLAERLVLFGNQAYALNAQMELGLQELAIDLMGDNLLVSITAQWPMWVNSSQVFQGVIVMDYLGTPFIMVPQPERAEPVRAEVLKDYRMLAAIGNSNELVLAHALSRKDGQIYRLWLRRTGNEMLVADATPLDEPELSAAINGKGVIVTISEDDNIALAAPGTTTQRELTGTGASRDMRLFSLNEGIAYVRDRDVFKLSMS